MAAKSSFRLTYATMFDPPEELHTRFEETLAQMKRNLGQEHGMLIAGEDYFAAEKFPSHSPSNTDVVLGLFQKGTFACIRWVIREIVHFQRVLLKIKKQALLRTTQ